MSKPADSEANSSSSSGRRLALTSLTDDLEHRVLAAELAGVVLRERDLDVAGLAGGRAGELLLKSGDQPTRAELEQLVTALAPFEWLPVESTEVVHDDVVALLGGSLDGVERREAVA